LDPEGIAARPRGTSPRHDHNLRSSDSAALVAHRGICHPADVTAETALIVEDEPAIRHGLVELLRTQGFDLDVAVDGHEAQIKLKTGRYDLVLLDWMLPGVDGLTLLQRLRARGDLTPVLMLTARGAEADIVAGIDAGADDYVTKPFGIRELVARVRGLLRRPGPRAAPAAFASAPPPSTSRASDHLARRTGRAQPRARA
jgi:DNA-binding response OmpR family regulator